MLENINKSKRQFINLDKISKHLYCVICHQVFENPSRLACSHTFCLVCIQYWGLINKKCPICKSSIRQRKLQKDLIAQQIIDDLDVKCSHQNCTWTGVYSQLKRHQRTCQLKPKKQFVEQKFGQKIQIQEIQDHPQQLTSLKPQGVKKRKTDTSQNGIRIPNFNNQNFTQQNDNSLESQGRQLFEDSQIVFYDNPPPPTSANQLQRGQIRLQQASRIISLNNPFFDIEQRPHNLSQQFSIFSNRYLHQPHFQRLNEIQKKVHMRQRQKAIGFQQ